MTATHVTAEQLGLLQTSRPLKTDEGAGGPDSDLARLAELISNQASADTYTLHCTPGQIICREGEPGDALYLIQSGTAAVFKGKADAPLLLARRGSGEIIGEMALLDDLPRSASVVAMDALTLLRLPREDFQQLMLQSPAADVDMLRKFSHRLRSADTVLTHLSSSETRLSGRVSELATENQELLELQRLRQQTMDLVIHDLRNPLQGITAAADLLRATLPEAEVARNIKLFTYINAHCTRLQHLVDSLIDISRMESGQLHLMREPTDLGQLLTNATERARPSFEANEMTCEVQLPAAGPALHVDVSLLDRVITNLLDNAVKFSPRRGRILVSGWYDADSATLTITDTGIGIPPAQREQMFERFARGSNPGTPRVGGFGLGLTFCRLAVEAHNGRIWVEEGPGGVGCRFLVSLPLRSDDAT